MPASLHSEGNQMTNETVRTKFEYVDDDEPEDPIGMLRDTIKRVMDRDVSEEMIESAYGAEGVKLYWELKNASK